LSAFPKQTKTVLVSACLWLVDQVNYLQCLGVIGQCLSMLLACACLWLDDQVNYSQCFGVIGQCLFMLLACACLWLVDQVSCSQYLSVIGQCLSLLLTSACLWLDDQVNYSQLLASACLWLVDQVNYSQCLGVIGYSLLPLTLIALVLPAVHSLQYISLAFKVGAWQCAGQVLGLHYMAVKNFCSNWFESEFLLR